MGDKLLLLFENTEIVKNHILNTVWREKLFSEHDLLRQLDIFNELIAEPGELRCTMIILNDIDWERSKRIKLWKEVSSHIYLLLDDGSKVYGSAPEIAVVNQHPCSMRVLTFACHDKYPIGIGSAYRGEPEYNIEEKLSAAQQKALREDLTESNLSHLDPHNLIQGSDSG